MKKYKYQIIAVLLLVAGIYTYFEIAMGDFREKARESGAKTIAMGIVMGERIFYEEYKNYSSNLEEIGFSSEGYKIYFTKDELPAPVKSLLSTTQEPFLKDNDFAFVIEDFGASPDQSKFYFSNSQGEIQKIGATP